MSRTIYLRVLAGVSLLVVLLAGLALPVRKAGAVALPPSIAKAFGAASINVNGTTSLTITISNPNGTPLTGVGFTDTLPSGLVFASPSNLSSSCPGGVAFAGSGPPAVLSLNGATLAGLTSCQVAANVTSATVGTYVNTTGAVTSVEGGAGNTATATLLVKPLPPSIAKSFGAASIIVDGTTSLTITISNPNGTPLTGVGFTDTLPSGLLFASPSNLSSTCGGVTIAVFGPPAVLSLTGGTLAGGASCQVAANVQGTTAGAKVNVTSAVSSTESGPGSTATATLNVMVPPTLTKAFGAASIAFNGSTSLSFTLTNPNASASLSGLSFTDTLPAGLVISTPLVLTGSCDGGTINIGAASVSLTGATLAGGASCTFSTSVTGIAGGLQHNVTSAVTSVEGGNGASAIADVTVATVAPAITSANSATFTVGTPGSFTVTATGTPAPTLSEAGALPGGVTFNPATGALSGMPSVGTQGIYALTFTASNGTTPNAVQNFTLIVNPSCVGQKLCPQIPMPVVLPPKLTKAFGPLPPKLTVLPVGTSVGLTFTITNPNASTLTGVGFNDALPTGMFVSTPNGLSGSCGGGVITASAGSGAISLAGATLGPNATCTFTVNVTGTTAGVKVNTAAATSTEGGTGPSTTASVTFG